MGSLAEKINKLKELRQAVLLAHNYQPGEVQDVADYVGDSLGLSIEAAKTAAKVIVFCGVDFMAETAAILSPDKTVLVPESNAGCPMANMIDAAKLRALKAEHSGVPVVCYVNSSAAVKAESNICCTSANAAAVVRSLPDKEILFVPDKFLGQNTQKAVPEKKLYLFDGYCPTHAKIMPQHIVQARGRHQGIKVLVHPECRPDVVALADAALSTDGMLRYVKNSPDRGFIIGTEIGIIHRLNKENPDKDFYPLTDLAVCPNMKMTTLEKVLWSLEDMKAVVQVDEATRGKAKIAIDRMLAVGRQE
ncbi:MAG: quinolinate synthase NadA [Candidatus Margulisbacteria bacterium]|nr:quinolinate synthase NadA [Candidatus Margulisiibacteriota bacterium]